MRDELQPLIDTLRAVARARVAAMAVGDVTQSTLARMLPYPHHMREAVDLAIEKNRLTPWAYQVLRSAVAAHYRKASREPAVGALCPPDHRCMPAPHDAMILRNQVGDRNGRVMAMVAKRAGADAAWYLARVAEDVDPDHAFGELTDRLTSPTCTPESAQRQARRVVEKLRRFVAKLLLVLLGTFAAAYAATQLADQVDAVDHRGARQATAPGSNVAAPAAVDDGTVDEPRTNASPSPPGDAGPPDSGLTAVPQVKVPKVEQRSGVLTDWEAVWLGTDN